MSPLLCAASQVLLLLPALLPVDSLQQPWLRVRQLACVLSEQRPCFLPPPCAPPGKRGGGGKAREQCLFLPYVDAVSVVVAGKEDAQLGGGAWAAAAAEGGVEGGGGGGSFLPPNMPGFTRLDLDFICAFTEVGWPVR